jgi:single-stranded DNA-binding protein
VFVDAELDWRDWTTQDGQQRETITLKARQILFEGNRAQTTDPGNGTAAAGTEQAPTTPPPASTRRPATAAAGTATADDLPF